MNSSPLQPFDSQSMIQSLDTSGRGLRIAFFKPDCAPDRYRHQIGIVQKAGTMDEKVWPVLFSAEGNGPDGFPISPPLQSLSIEERPTGAVALLVGMAGRNHWSASVVAPPHARCLEFDLACKADPEDANRLISTYFSVYEHPRLQESSSIELAPIDRKLGRLRVTLGAGLASHKLSQRGFILQVAVAPTNPVRWKYVMRLDV